MRTASWAAVTSTASSAATECGRSPRGRGSTSGCATSPPATAASGPARPDSAAVATATTRSTGADGSGRGFAGAPRQLVLEHAAQQLAGLVVGQLGAEHPGLRRLGRAQPRLHPGGQVVGGWGLG